MKCSLKDGFIYILLIIFIAPSEGVKFPLRLQRNSITDEPMNFRKFRIALNRLQDSFPNDGDVENNLHKIVKKQMAVSDSENSRKRKSVFNLLFGEGDDFHFKDHKKSKKAVNNLEKRKRNNQQSDHALIEDSSRQIFFSRNKRSISSTPKDILPLNVKKEMMLPKQKEDSKYKQPKNPNYNLNPNAMVQQKIELKEVIKEEEESNKKKTLCATPTKNEKDVNKIQKENPIFRKSILNLPDERDNHCYYEMETSPLGCIKLRHKRCPQGMFFCIETKKCSKNEKGGNRKKRQVKFFRSPFKSKKPFINFNLPGDTDQANEWLDASRRSQIPPEFKPIKTPELKIYHLTHQNAKNRFLIKKRNVIEEPDSTNKKKEDDQETEKSIVKREESKTRRSKSFIIHIHKKAGKDENVAENEENDESEEEDEENDDEEEDEDDNDDEDDESEDEISDVEITRKTPSSPKETIKEFLKSAKEAVTNRAKSNEGPNDSKIYQKSSLFKSKKSDSNSFLKGKKSDSSEESENENKKVLIDANIKVDSAISNALKCVLKSKMNENQDVSNKDSMRLPEEDEMLRNSRNSRDQLNPKVVRLYERSLRHNPRVKKYFQS